MANTKRRHSRIPHALTAAMAAVAMLGSGLAVTAPSTADGATPLADSVNPFIGTQDEGNTYPGASTPFGMVQFSPDNGHNVGYDYTRDSIRGFSLVHISGVGCSLGGPQPMLPTTGAVNSTDNAEYALKYSHEAESASAGQYSVDLQAPGGTVTADLTATARTGVARYTYPETDEAMLMVNVGQALNGVTSSSVKILDERTIETEITTAGFCQDTPEVTFYTTTVFDRDIAEAGTWEGDEVTDDQESAGEGRRGAWVQFDTTDGDTTVEAQTSLSYVDSDGARANLEAERATYEEALADTKAEWEERLHSIDIEGADETTERVFNSALYRSFLAPNLGSDVDGRYTGWDQKIHKEDDPDFSYYQNFSLWDTYRTQEQFVAMVDPDVAADQALSLVRQGQHSGWLPRWGFGTVETNIMTGDPGTIWLVQAWAQGLLKGHEEETYQLLIDNADGVPPTEWFANGRAGNAEYLADGYVPQDPSTRKGPGDYDLDHGGSATLEYALADASLSVMASALGFDDDAERLAARGTSYRNLFDPSTGHFRARDRSGAFYGSEDPAQARGFHEATASQYMWLVQQNPYDLMEMIGAADGKDAKEATIERLDHFFAFPEVVSDPAGTALETWVSGAYDYYGFDTYNPNNEPDFHAPWMYLWAGQPWKTSDVLVAARTLFTDGPTGVTGNDDLGTMSSWYVFASIGLFPAVPGTDMWTLATPAFEKVTIQRPDGKPLVITADGVSDSNRYIEGVSADGSAWDKGYIEDADLDGVSTLAFDVGAEAGASDWATGDDAAPAAMIEGSEGQERLGLGVDPEHLWAVPGGEISASASVIAQGPGTVSGEIAAASDSLWVSLADSEWSVESGGFPVGTSSDVTVEVPEWTPSGAHEVSLEATAGDLESSLDVDVSVGPESFLKAHLNNTAIGDVGGDGADFDGLGYFYPRDLLAQAGVPTGVLTSIPDSELQYWISGDAGEPDNVLMKEQTIELPEALASSGQIALVGAANNGSFSEEIVLGLQDEKTGDTSDVTTEVALPDWCSGKNPEDGSTVLGVPSQRGGKNGAEGANCGLYATQPVNIPEGQNLISIQLPNNSKMHLFAIATDAPQWVEPELTAGVAAVAEVAEVAANEGADADVEAASGELTIQAKLDPEAAGTIRVYEGREALADSAVDSGSAEVVVTGLDAGEHELRVAFIPDDFVAWSATSADLIAVEVDDEQDPGTDPSDPGTDPTEPGTDPSDPGTDPTDPGTDPSEPGDVTTTDPSGSENGTAGPGTDSNAGDWPGSEMPNTGARVAGIGAAALLLTAAGVVLVARRRMDG